MRAKLIKLVAVAVLVIGAIAPSCAETWMVASLFGALPTDSITFTFNNYSLGLNTSEIHKAVYEGDQLLATYDYTCTARPAIGLWAICGGYSADGIAVLDAYASFVSNAFGYGQIVWASDTPYGYQTNLVLGKSGTQSSLNLGYTETHDGGFISSRTPLYHTFAVSYVPEPASIIALASGLLAAAGLIRRKMLG